FVGSALCVRAVRVPPTLRTEEPQGGFRELIAGFRYVQHRPYIAALLTAKMGWGLSGGSQLLTTIYGQRLFPIPNDRNGVLTVSLLVGAGGIGTALGPIVGRRLVGSDRQRMAWAIAVSFLIGGVFYLAMGRASS